MDDAAGRPNPYLHNTAATINVPARTRLRASLISYYLQILNIACTTLPVVQYPYIRTQLKHTRTHTITAHRLYMRIQNIEHTLYTHCTHIARVYMRTAYPYTPGI